MENFKILNVDIWPGIQIRGLDTLVKVTFRNGKEPAVHPIPPHPSN